MKENLYPAVPERYHGVWARTLLETPDGRDTTTWVRWLQAGQWHADLRIPSDLDRSQFNGLAQQQGFCGVTQITAAQGDETEICTWHRRHDFQPPRSTPDAGTMVFETPDRVIERGIHGTYLEVWERLPESMGRRIVLQGLNADGQTTNERLLIVGSCLMHVRPRNAPWPTDLQPDESLLELIPRHATLVKPWLDFEITFATQQGNVWCVERSTLPPLEGKALFSIGDGPQRTGQPTAHFAAGPFAGEWRIVEWDE